MNRRLARFAAVVLMLALPLSAAAVQLPQQGLVPDATRAEQRRGVEILHPLKVDRAAFERAGAGGGAWMPATHGSPQFAAMQRTERARNGDWTWVGRVDTDFGPQSAVITFGRDAVFGLIPQRHGRALRIETRYGKTWLVENFPTYKTPAPGTSDARIPPSPTSTVRADFGPVARASQPGGVTAQTAAEVDVLVVYNASMVTAYGSDSAVQTRINQVAAIANQAYVDSGAAMHINIVAAKLIDYTATTDNGAALDLLTNTSTDPVKVQVDAWRNQYGADLVSLVRHFDNVNQTNCGLAWVDGYHGSPYNATYGFSAVSDGSDGGFYCFEQTFAHELGHNMGGGHDIVTDNGDYGAYTYSRGHRADVGAGGFATVMAYPTGNQDVVSLFSSPLLTTACLGQPCGVAGESDNVQTFGNSGPSIAAYRAHVNQVGLSIGDVTVTEGNAGTKVATFTVTLSAAAASAVTYDIATSNGTATAGSDYVASSLGGQSIAAGSTTKTFSVTINGDTTWEPDETFTVTVSNVSGATLTDGTATGTVTNDDGPVLTIGDMAVAEGNSGTKVATFTVKLSAAAGSTVTFDAATANGTASSASDYVALALVGQTIAAGATTKSFNVTLNGDATVEANETYTVNVTNVSGPVQVGDASAVGTILNDDGPVLTVGDVSITEGASGTKYALFNVTLSQTVGSPVTFSFATANGTATAGSDYGARNLTGQTIAAGTTTKAISVAITGDATVEANETFFALVSAVTGPVTVLDDRATGTIVNDDGPTLSIADVPVVEGNSGSRTVAFTVKLSTAAAVPVTFDIGTAPGTATAGTDYVTKTLTSQSIAAGVTTYGFTVSVPGDATIEPNETYFVNLSNASGATIADAQAVGTIINDEGPLLTIGDVAVTEGNSGTKFATFTLTLSQVAATPVTYGLLTVNGTATGGNDATADFQQVNVGGLSIAAGMLSKTASVKLFSDTNVEANEVFYLLLTNVGGGATVYDDRAIGTITNDD